MKIGIGLPNPIPHTPGRVLVEWAKRAEERGFSTLATIDRVVYPSYDSLIAHAAAAGATERIGLLTNVLLGPTRNGVILAKEAASLDQVSNGRFILGLAVGGRPDDFEAVGQDMSRRGRVLDEQLEQMHSIWRGEPLPGGTQPLSPRPVNGDRVPIVFGGSSPAAVARVVRYGIGWTAGGAPPEMTAPVVAQVRQAWKEAGREGEPRLIALTYYGLGPNAEAGINAYLNDYYAFLGAWGSGIAAGAARSTEDVRTRVKIYEDAGFDELIFDPTIGDPQQVDLLADAVL